MDRIFPRYNTSHLGIIVRFSTFETAEYYLENASLSGLQIYGKSKIVTNDFNKISIVLSEKETLSVNALQVWSEDKVELSPYSNTPLKDYLKDPCFRCGMKLKFIEKAHYEKWFKFINALHNVQSKKLVIKN